MDNRAVGVFDSGVGGLTVVSEIMRALPDEEIIYFGDTARAPYGPRSPRAVTEFSRQIISFLLTKDVKAVVIACNTACACGLETLSAEFGVPLLGMIAPGADAGIRATRGGAVGVIGTAATVRSGAYERALRQRREGIAVYSKACPLFAPLAEEGWTDNAVARMTAEIYLGEFAGKGIDTLILGCTHYPLLYGCIRRALGGARDIHIVDPAENAAAAIKAYLLENNMLRAGAAPEHKFYVSEETPAFGKLCGSLLGRGFAAEKLDIGAFNGVKNDT